MTADVTAFANERWKAIAGAPGYSVSDHGRVRNDRTGHVLVPFLCGRPYVYLRVDLWINAGKKPALVHRLVAEAFIPKDPDPRIAFLRREVNHFDNDTSNNHYSNLEWVTRRENEMHKRFMELTA